MPDELLKRLSLYYGKKETNISQDLKKLENDETHKKYMTELHAQTWKGRGVWGPPPRLPKIDAP